MFLVAYENSTNKKASTEELFPLMVYIILQSNPDNFLSELK